MTDLRQRLQGIRTFPSLVKFLREELDWPIDSDADFEDLTFDYTPEELGIDPTSAAKIEEIKRLRPLDVRQPWGIFFVKFEPKQLPVVALRRILNRVVVKKRATSSAAEQQKWATDDLLFISAYGEHEERRISFAHFSYESSATNLPTLKVLAWDDQDTGLHLDDVAQRLVKHLAWPGSEWDDETWRERWGSAFELRPREVIVTSKALAIRLAELARSIRVRIRGVIEIESADGPVRSLMKAFREALIHDLEADDFADMYAQTVAYGLLSARVANPMGDGSAEGLPLTNPFLKELMDTFLQTGTSRNGAQSDINFDELGVTHVVQLLDDANMEAIVRDFGDRNPQEDPVIHFYELFLKEYDAQKRMQRGVFYTPRPVVSYIVRAIHELLRSDFDLEYGLADTTSWREMAERLSEITVPEGVDPEQPFVQILDPAAGTGTFLVEAVGLIHEVMEAEWRRRGYDAGSRKALWNEYVPSKLLPRLHGYEVLMAPYAIAHLKMGLMLYETGYDFESDERVRIYLTNALEPPTDGDGQLEFAVPALAHEAEVVNEVKRCQRFTVVMGNPPYSVTSLNSNPFVDELMMDYKRHVRGERGLVALADDYLKFIRLSEWALEATGCGVWGMITNHGYLRGVIHRGVRRELVDQFRRILVLDLHGDSNVGETPPVGEANDNVFDIKQGVAIALGVSGSQRARSAEEEPRRDVVHADSWGTRSDKYAMLGERNVVDVEWSELRPSGPDWLLIPFDADNLDEYRAFPSLAELMPVHSCGVKTHRDGFVIDFDRDVLHARFSDVALEPNVEVLRARYAVKDTPHWKLEAAQKKVTASAVDDRIFPITYRPFDDRWIYYNPGIIEKGDSKYPTLRHMLRPNRALLASRIQAAGASNAVFVTRLLAEMKTAEATRSCTVFPLFLYENGLAIEERRSNLSPGSLGLVTQALGASDNGDAGGAEIAADEVFDYAYATFYSPGYRARYSEFLRNDFPRVPPPGSLELFRELSGLGRELVALHLMESSELESVAATYVGPAEPQVGRAGWLNGVVWLDMNATKTAGVASAGSFSQVPERVWWFEIGGYQVCHKWLKDRKGRSLAPREIEHYQRIVVALTETIRVMEEIDNVIEQHGGWPRAFTVPETTAVTA